VRIDLDPAGVERCLGEAGIAFMFAPVFHPAMAHAAGVRRELRVPTAFNFLGPLTNPARPTAQIVGVSDQRMLPFLAEVLARRGTTAMVFRGNDGLDELTTTGSSTVYRVAGGTWEEEQIDPQEVGLSRANPEDLRGGDVGRNVEIARAVLGGELGPARDVVLLNAAAALTVADRASDLREGVALAGETLDSGAAARTLERWIEVSAPAAGSP
jgi:anthranilate phosphoribosyltransferase